MEFTSQLRQHLGESACLVDVHRRADRRGHLIDFTKTRRGKEVTLIEVGEHGITVEFVASGQKHINPFDEIQVKERTSGKTQTSKKSYRTSRKSV